MTVTVDTFLGRMKRRITVPANQVLLTDDQMLQMADDVTMERVVPLILSCMQNFFVYEEEIAGVESQSAYAIPYRSIGRGLRDLKVRWGGDENGLTNMTQVALEDAHQWTNNAISNTPRGFYFKGDKFVILPEPLDDDFTLIAYYNMQPNSLVLTSDAAVIETVAGAVVTCTNVPSTFLNGTEIDFIKGRAGCATLVPYDVAITNVGGLQLTFSADDIPSDLAAGDYISLAKTTPVVQLPDEAVPLLECWTAERVCEAIGDMDNANLLANRAIEVEKNLKMVLSPRIEGAQTKIVNRNGLLRRGNQAIWGWNGNGGV